MKIAEGKPKGLERLANARGVIAALAIDQRSALRSLFAKAKGVQADAVPGEWLVQFKEAVSDILTPQASAILLDPEYGLPAAKRRAKNAGLLLAYEKTGYDKRVPGRLPQLLEHWSVRRLIEAGADGAKILLYYAPSSSAEVNDQKHAWIERIGAECVAADVPFFLELVSYQEGMDEKGRDFAKCKPGVVKASVEEFSKPRYAVDVLKVGVPVNMAYVEGSPSAASEILYSREQAKKYFREAAAAARVPFIYLSEGVSNETFEDALELAGEAGATFSGVLCGRATWKDGVAVFAQHGMSALEEWLGSEGIRNIQRVNAKLSAARPWTESYARGPAAAPSGEQS
ncbi:MAG TPA: tagatose 1,6-diphosphate aldolase [Candidatus Acidoferrum sp.]|nr:tagatose 1,6-diphosphate aldolase [Candidatus Acidoferrum sp.]